MSLKQPHGVFNQPGGQPQQHDEEQDQHGQSSSDARGDVQRCAKGHAGQQIDRRPENSGDDVSDHEIAPVHVHHPGYGGNRAAHRAEKAPKQHALTAMYTEEFLAAGDHLRAPGERPDPPDTLMEDSSDPEADGVADDGAPGRPPVGGPEIEVTEADQRAQTEHDQGAGDNHANNGQRLGHR